MCSSGWNGDREDNIGEDIFLITKFIDQNDRNLSKCGQKKSR